MTGYRHRYAEALTDWADMHGEATAERGPVLNQCGRPGHREYPIHDECDDCNREAHDDWHQAQRHTTIHQGR